MANRLSRIEERLESLETVVSRENHLSSYMEKDRFVFRFRLDFQNSTYNNIFRDVLGWKK